MTAICLLAAFCALVLLRQIAADIAESVRGTTLGGRENE